MPPITEPTDQDRAAFRRRMAARLPTLTMLFDAAVELHRCYDHNAALIKLGLEVTREERDATRAAERRWAQAKKLAKRRPL
jgi:hypothetical protein